MHDPDSNGTSQKEHLLGSRSVNRFSGAMLLSSVGIESLKYDFIGKFLVKEKYPIFPHC
jgi:hypothetical protein